MAMPCSHFYSQHPEDVILRSLHSDEVPEMRNLSIKRQYTNCSFYLQAHLSPVNKGSGGIVGKGWKSKINWLMT